MMLYLVTAACLLAMAASQTKYCCPPDQYEVILQTLTGSVRSGDPNATITNGTQKTSIDTTNKRIAVTSKLTSAGVPVDLQMIQDFSKGLQYEIQGGTCKTTTLGSWTSLCVPDDARLLESNYYGIGQNMLPVDIYMYTKGANTVYLNVAKDGCTPMSEGVYGSLGGVSAESSVLFTNFTVGIKDPAVFTPPAICNNPLQLADEHQPRLRRYAFGFHLDM